MMRPMTHWRRDETGMRKHATNPNWNLHKNSSKVSMSQSQEESESPHILEETKERGHPITMWDPRFDCWKKTNNFWESSDIWIISVVQLLVL